MISLESLSKSFGKKTVLKDINLTFESGKTYGIVGSNGAGKTTLFNCIAGLETFKGSIKSKHEHPKNTLGFLPTHPYYFSKITGQEYINFVCQSRDISIENMASKNIFDLPLNHYATTYSTGMQKKLALTAILLQQNNWFILDEPFNGVDIQSNILITEILLHLKSLQKTIIMSSHIFQTLKDTCDEIFFLDKGQIEAHILKGQFEQFEAEMKTKFIGKKITELQLK